MYNTVLEDKRWAKSNITCTTSVVKTGGGKVTSIVDSIPVIYSSANPCVGTVRKTSCNRGRKKPILLLPTSVEHQVNTGVALPSTVDIYRIVYNVPCRVLRYDGGCLAAYIQNIASPNLIGLGTLGGSEQQAMILSARAQSMSADYDVGTFLGEFPETLSMLNPLLRKLPKKLKVFTRLGYSGKKAWDFASSKWMEYRYGILPLLRDIDNIRNLADRQFHADRSLQYSKASRVIPGTETLAPFTRSALGAYFFGFVRSKASVRLAARDFYMRTNYAKTDLGCGFDNLRPTAWELVPYSFVVDWFIDVGTWLAALRPKPYTTALQTSFSYSITESWDYAVNAASLVSVPGGSYPRCQCSSNYSFDRTSYIRNANVPLPAYPQVNLDFTSLLRQLDGLSLSWQKLSKLLPRR